MNETRILSLVLQTTGCLPALVWGDFGIGKTARISQLAETMGWECEILRPAERGEGALGVVPVPSEDRQVLHYPQPDWAQRLIQSEKPGLIFLDEISSCPPALQPAIMGLALDGVIAGKRLPDRIRRIAAGNPVDQAAGGWDLAPALANRFIHLSWKSPEPDHWTAWLAGTAGGAEAISLDLDEWEKQWTQARALGMAFIRSHPSCLHEDVSKITGRVPQSYATPRTWECALRLLASCRAAKCMDLYPELAHGALGPGVALEGDKVNGAWLVWLNENDLPDPEELLENPEKFSHDPKRPDRTFATLIAVGECGLATVNGNKLSQKDREMRWEAAWSVMSRAMEMKLGKDIVLLPARMLASRDRAPRCMPGPSAKKVCGVLSEFIDLFDGK